MDKADPRARTCAYKQTARPAGVYRVRNTLRGKTLVDSSTNLPGILNRHRFQLEGRLHRNQELQNDYDPTDDLAVLLAKQCAVATSEVLVARRAYATS